MPAIAPPVEASLPFETRSDVARLEKDLAPGASIDRVMRACDLIVISLSWRMDVNRQRMATPRAIESPGVAWTSGALRAERPSSLQTGVQFTILDG
jgi:hypothetical protein